MGLIIYVIYQKNISIHQKSQWPWGLEPAASCCRRVLRPHGESSCLGLPEGGSTGQGSPGEGYLWVTLLPAEGSWFLAAVMGFVPCYGEK